MLRSRQALGSMLLAVFLSGCIDAPTQPLLSPHDVQASKGVMAQEAHDAEGRLHKIERSQESARVARIRWTIDGKPVGQLVAHYGKDGALARVTGTIDFRGRIVNVDHVPGRHRSPGEVGASWDNSCFWTTLAFYAAAAALAAVVATSPISWPELFTALALYAYAADEKTKACGW